MTIKNPLIYKTEPPRSFVGLKLSMVFHGKSNNAKLFLKNPIDGWSIVVWTGYISDTVRDICVKNSLAVIESKNEKYKLLCMYKIKHQNDILLCEV